MLKRKKDGQFLISSNSHVAEALRVLEDLETELEVLMLDPEIASRRNDIRDLKAAIDAYILESEENYEDEDYKLTRVQGFRRHWDTAKLEKILPRGIFKNIVTVQADPQKIDQYVREGTLKLQVIAPAFVEIPNAAYVKMTKKSPQAEKGEAEAGSLAEALG